MEKEQNHICPHCGNDTILKLISETEVEESLYDMDNSLMTTVCNYYFIFLCITCDRASIYANFCIYPEKEHLQHLQLIFPQLRDISQYLSGDIRSTYLEAKRIQQLSSTSFILLIRKSLEQICSDQNANGLTLYDKINDLMSKGILPIKIGQLASMIRIVGNKSAHADEYFDCDDVDDIDEFFHHIAEYFYALDARMRYFIERWEAYGRGLPC